MLKFVRLAIGLATSVGASMIITNIVKSTTPKDIGIIRKFCIALGSFGIGAYFGNKASDHVKKTMDCTVGIVKEYEQEARIKEAKERA